MDTSDHSTTLPTRGNVCVESMQKKTFFGDNDVSLFSFRNVILPRWFNFKLCVERHSDVINVIDAAVVAVDAVAAVVAAVVAVDAVVAVVAVVHVGIAVAHHILHFSSTYVDLKNVNSLHCLELSKFICLKMS